MMDVRTSLADNSGENANNNAATPATCGAAIEVPLNCLKPRLLGTSSTAPGVGEGLAEGVPIGVAVASTKG